MTNEIEYEQWQAFLRKRGALIRAGHQRRRDKKRPTQTPALLAEIKRQLLGI